MLALSCCSIVSGHSLTQALYHEPSLWQVLGTWYSGEWTYHVSFLRSCQSTVWQIYDEHSITREIWNNMRHYHSHPQADMMVKWGWGKWKPDSERQNGKVSVVIHLTLGGLRNTPRSLGMPTLQTASNSVSDICSCLQKPRVNHHLLLKENTLNLLFVVCKLLDSSLLHLKLTPKGNNGCFNIDLQHHGRWAGNWASY